MQSRIIKAIIIAIIAILIDYFHKDLSVKFMAERNYYPLEITSFFNYVMVWNKGISFGLFQSGDFGRMVLIIMPIIVSIWLLYWLKTQNKTFHIIAIGLIVGGALGNVIDRLKYKAVADFFDFHAFNYHWPAFNIADSWIFIGVFTLLIGDFIVTRKEKKNA